jgi:hypothetical protein
MNNSKRITAKFYPQAWINDYACDVDPGPVEFDVTEEVVKMGREAALQIEDNDYDSDGLREFAPQEWVQDWGGPFRVKVQQSIREYFQ